MRLVTGISIALLAVLVASMVACGELPFQRVPYDPTENAELTRDLVKGLLSSYANSESGVGEDCLFLKYSERPHYQIWERDSATLTYSESDGKWEWIATGVGCAGIQKWEIDDISGEVVHIPSPKLAIVTPISTATVAVTPTRKPTANYSRFPTRAPASTPTPRFTASPDCAKVTNYSATYNPEISNVEQWNIAFRLTNICDRDFRPKTLQIIAYHRSGRIIDTTNWSVGTLGANESKVMSNRFNSQLGSNVNNFELEFR